MHEVPRFIEIKGYTLQEEFSGAHFMSDVVFDTAIRRYKQLDQYMYQTPAGLRWRHFLVSDYAVSMALTLQTMPSNNPFLYPTI